MPITFEHVSHTYSEGTPFQYAALKDVNLDIREGKITAIKVGRAYRIPKIHLLAYLSVLNHS